MEGCHASCEAKTPGRYRLSPVYHFSCRGLTFPYPLATVTFAHVFHPSIMQSLLVLVFECVCGLCAHHVYQSRQIRSISDLGPSHPSWQPNRCHFLCFNVVFSLLCKQKIDLRQILKYSSSSVDCACGCVFMFMCVCLCLCCAGSGPELVTRQQQR